MNGEGRVSSSDYSTVRERIEALPEEGATHSRDYGRGYAQAIRDVIRLMHAHDRHWLEEPCECDPLTVDMQNLRTPMTTPARTPTES